jgi:hypothetical protein
LSGFIFKVINNKTNHMDDISKKNKSANIPERGVNLLVTLKQNFNNAFVIFPAG